MKLKDYTQAQQQAWDEVAFIHKEANFDQLLLKFKQPGYSCLDTIETSLLQKIGLQGKSVVQLGCNNGRELLSVKNLGADRCVGFDISSEFIEQARTLASTTNIDCEFEHGDIYDIPVSYNSKFDLVYITVGVICWMPDLVAFFDVVARLLKPGGQVLIYEMHPFLGVFSENNKGNTPTLELSYFSTQANFENSSLDYYTQKEYVASPRWWFHYKISDLFEAALMNDMVIQSFKEYDHDVSGVFSYLQNQQAQLPLSYSLILRKI